MIFELYTLGMQEQLFTLICLQAVGPYVHLVHSVVIDA